MIDTNGEHLVDFKEADVDVSLPQLLIVLGVPAQVYRQV